MINRNIEKSKKLGIGTIEKSKHRYLDKQRNRKKIQKLKHGKIDKSKILGIEKLKNRKL